MLDKVLYLTNIDNLMDRIYDLKQNNKRLDKETYELYKKVQEESKDLAETVEDTGWTEPRSELNNIFRMIKKIFNGKNNTSTDSEKKTKR